MRANAEISTAHRKGYRVAGIFTGRCKHGTVLAMADIFSTSLRAITWVVFIFI